MEKLIGQITHYFDHIGVAVIKLSGGEPKVGATIHLVGHGADFTQVVDSMQVEHQSIEVAKKGDDVGMKVSAKVKPGTEVYLVE
jgi:putative protease